MEGRTICRINENYDRNRAKEYAERYALNPNIDEYPYFKNDDCANFISQVLRAGGMAELGNNWDSIESWFCRTKDTKDLKNISLTWRAARYFRRHWGNEDGLGLNRAAEFTTINVLEALENFSRLYDVLKIGDVIQYGSPESKYPYHTQVIHDKGYNEQINRYDLYMAQHTANRVYVSLYTYLENLDYKELRPVYIYKIKDD